MGVTLDFDSEQGNYFARALVLGLNLSPGPWGTWPTNRLITLAGACLCLCARRMETVPRAQIRAAAGWAAEAIELVLAGVHDHYLERKHTAEVSIDDGVMRVVIVRGRKPWDADCN